MMRQKNFNPHFRKGSDKEELRLFLFCKEISIHTSAMEVKVWSDSLAEPYMHFNPHFRKGSDSAGCPRYCHYDDFNPHFRKGSDSTERAKTDEPYDFNPHFRKGSDCIISRIEQKWNYFNPHFRKGSDEGKWIIPSSVHISIHTSAREVTKCKQYRRINSLFQSTLPQGKWLFREELKGHQNNFNPHFRKGSDILDDSYPVIVGYFNPHFRKGSDPSVPVPLAHHSISIHTSAREVTSCIIAG